MSKFIKFVNSWFDIFNSKSPYHKNNSKTAFNIHLSDQIKVLNTMLTTVYNIKDGTKECLLPFQKGISVLCQSLLNIYDFFKFKV